MRAQSPTRPVRVTSLMSTVVALLLAPWAVFIPFALIVADSLATQARVDWKKSSGAFYIATEGVLGRES